MNVCFLASVNAKEAEELIINPQEATSTDVVDRREILKQELKSVVGRMLWKDVWGSYVQADRWWWEDESIIEECEEMRTCWEYAVIEAVKEG